MGGFGAVRELAMRQRGVVTLAQMHAAGISPRQVERGLERGDLVRLHRAVYRLGPVSLPLCPEMAATLAGGANAVLSHRSAAAMYEILDPQPGAIHITVAHRHRRGDAGIVVHETASLGAHEIRERRGVPLTAPIRTLIDLSGECTPEDLERAVSEAFAHRLTTSPRCEERSGRTAAGGAWRASVRCSTTGRT
jgi:predicted transcriptional regulator of viral defense system